jgi:hypothetical protein
MSRSNPATWVACTRNRSALLRHRQIGAEIEQIVLNEAEHGIEIRRRRQMQPRHADGGVGLVDGATASAGGLATNMLGGL